MAKRSIFEGLLSVFAKSADKAIKNAIFGERRPPRRRKGQGSNSQNSHYDMNRMMVDNRVRILNESIKLLETSKNIKVLIGRKEIALEQIDWFVLNQNYNTILNSNPEHKRDSLINLYNERLFDRIEEIVTTQEEKGRKLKTKNAKENLLKKAEGIIQDNTIHFDKNASNYDEYMHKLKLLSRRLEMMEV